MLIIWFEKLRKILLAYIWICQLSVGSEGIDVSNSFVMENLFENQSNASKI